MPDLAVEMLVVPDGYVIADGRSDRKVRISLSVAPSLTGNVTADLATWPRSIAQLSREIFIIRRDLIGETLGPETMRRAFPADRAGADFHPDATATWGRIFGGPAGFDALREAFAKEGELGEEPDKAKALVGEVQGIGSVPSLLFAQFVEQFQTLAASDALAARQDKAANASGDPGLPTRALWRSIAALAPDQHGDPATTLLGAALAGQPGMTKARLDDAAFPRLAEARLRRAVHAGLVSRDALTAAQKASAPDLADWTMAAVAATRQMAAIDGVDGLAGLVESLLGDPTAELAISLGLDKVKEITERLASDDREPVDKPEERAGRLIAGITASPALAKYFGLIVDVEIDADLLGEPGSFALGAVFAEGGGQADPREWTACLLTDDYFGPLSEREHALAGSDSALKAAAIDVRQRPALPQQRGLIQLGDTMAPNQARFGLYSVDGIKGILALIAKANALQDAERSGGSPEPVELIPPDVAEIGIALIDLAKPLEMKLQDEPQRGAVRFAEDLLRGVRVDCYLASAAETDGLPRDARRWRPLMDRDIEFEIPDAFYQHPAVQAVAHRDEGFAQSATVTSQTGQVDSPAEIAMWKGEGLGVTPPVPDNILEGNAMDAEQEVPIGRSVGYPLTAARKPPPLRFGRQYWFAARACYVNGCGLTLEQARSRYEAAASSPGLDRLLLGKDNAATPFTYGRSARIAAPTVLLPESSDIIRRGAAPPGKTITTLVIKQEDGAQDRDFRIVVPGRVSFDVAEQQGQFDDGVARRQAQPNGAFMGEVRLLMDERGAFPVARSGQVVAAGIGQGDDDPIVPRDDTRGSVAVFDDQAWPAGEYYFPDARARLLGAQVQQQFSTTKLPFDGSLAFWAGDRPRDAIPVFVRLRPADAGQAEDIAFARTTAENGTPHRLETLDIRLKPAVRATLELYGGAEADVEAKHHSVAHKAFDLAARKGLAPQSLTVAASQGPLATVQSITILDLVHAVQRPIARPQFDPEKITVIVGQADPASGLPQSPADSVEGGTTAFFEGSVTIDGPSTGRLRLDGEWREHGPEALMRTGSGTWLYNPPSQADIIASFDKISQPDNAFAFGSGKAEWPHFSFRDGRARALKLSTVATSAFTAFYPQGQPSDFEKGFAADKLVVVPCTFRPPEPDHWQALPVPYWKSTRNRTRRDYAFELEWSVRVYFGTNYMATGEGERIGLAFWKRQNDADPDTIAEYNRQAPMHQGVLTQWGNDPIDWSAPLPSALPKPEIFVDLNAGRNSPQTSDTEELLLPVPSDAARQTEGRKPDPLLVEILPFNTRVDPDEGPVIDIGMNFATPESYHPFLRLGLCRLQTNAIKGLELSQANPRTVVLLPPRKGRVKVSDVTNVDIWMWGPGYSERRLSRADDTYSRPRMTVRLMEYEPLDWPLDINNSPPLKPALDRSGRPIVEHAFASMDGGQAVFEIKGLKLPRSRSFRDYMLVIEEYEFFEGDPCYDWSTHPDVVVPADEIAGVGPVVSRLTFRRQIDLGRNARDPEDHSQSLGFSDFTVPRTSFPEDPELKQISEGLSPTALRGLEMLLQRYPGLVVVSGKRSVAAQARAMAENLRLDTSWMRRTYRASKQRDALLVFPVSTYGPDLRL